MRPVPCPHCGGDLPFATRWRMLGLVRWRRVQPCPHCGTPLRWSAAAYVANFESLAVIAASVLGLLGVWQLSPEVLLLCAVVGLLGTRSLRAEVAPDAGTSDSLRRATAEAQRLMEQRIADATRPPARDRSHW